MFLLSRLCPTYLKLNSRKIKKKKATSALSENAFPKFFVCHRTFDLPISWQLSAKGSEIRQATDVYRCLAIDGRDLGQET